MEKVYNSGKKEGAVMNFIKEHLNWTLFIGVLIIETPLMLVLYLLPEETIENIWWIVIPVILTEFALQSWYLHRKDRNYLYLLLNFIKPFYIPVGFLVLLALENHRENYNDR